MTVEKMREKLNAIWEAASQQADDLKDPMLAPERMMATYFSLDPEEQELADRVFAEWILGVDEMKRFDALALIGELRIASAAPELKTLVHIHESSDEPGASFELAKVQNLLRELGVDSAESA